MTHPWNNRLLPFLLILAFAATPTVSNAGGSTDGPVKDQALKKLEQMDKRLERSFKEISDDMNALKANALVVKSRLDKIEELETEIAQLRKDLVQLRVEVNDVKRQNTVTRPSLYPPAERPALDDRLSKIEQDLAALKGPSPRVSLSPPATGRLKLVNDLPEEVTFLINGQAVPVGPKATGTLEQVPAGTFTDEAMSPSWGSFARNSPRLAAGQTYTLIAR